MTFLVQQTLIYAVPLMIVALAGVFAERSGIINLALEGIMILGAFIGVLFVNIMQTNHVYDAAKAAGFTDAMVVVGITVASAFRPGDPSGGTRPHPQPAPARHRERCPRRWLRRPRQ